MLKEQTDRFVPFHDQYFLCLTTFRHDGEPVATPLRFAQTGDKLYVMTLTTADVVQRVHENAQVEVAPCTAQGDLLGEPLEGMAILVSAEQRSTARRALNRKYGWHRHLHQWIDEELRHIPFSYLEITPM